MELQIILTTVFSMLALIAFCVWIYRLAAIYEDHLWVEPTVIAILGFFIYLVWN